MNEILKIIKDFVVHEFFPTKCYLCGKALEYGKNLCDECAALVPRVETPICYHCAVEKAKCTCGNRKNRFVTAFAAPFYYDGIMKSAIKSFKRDLNYDRTRCFAMEMASFVKRAMDGVEFDLITYVPMSESEFSERGFSQCEILANCLSDIMSVPCKRVLTKLYDTDPQKELEQRYRSGNVFAAFDVWDVDSIKDKRILLCDDVLTTGTTLSECAKMLMLRGAREVMCVTIAVGLPRKK